MVCTVCTDLHELPFFADAISIKNLVSKVKLILFEKASHRTQCCPAKARSLETLMTQIRVCIGACQHKMKTLPRLLTGLKTAPREMFAAIFKKKNVAGEKCLGHGLILLSDFKAISFERKSDFAAIEQQRCRSDCESSKSKQRICYSLCRNYDR